MIMVSYKRIEWKILRMLKIVTRKIRPFKGKSPQKILILGCQRSGTTLLVDIFEKDLRSTVFREEGAVFQEDKSLRLKDFGAVNKILDNIFSRLIVIKPLLDSQLCTTLIESIPNSKAIWIYRNYKDVARSNLKLFGLDNGIKDLAPIVNGDFCDWKAENLSRETIGLIKRHYSSDMNPYDAASLFWYVRNVIFFEQNLMKNENVILCKYEDLVSKPFETVEGLYRFAEMEIPNSAIVRDVHCKSKGKGNCITISPEVENLCDELLDKMDFEYKRYNFKNY